MAKPPAKTKPEQEEAKPLCSREELLEAARSQARVRDAMHRLAKNPPQVLVLEGGDVRGRDLMAVYWAACLNCRPGGLLEPDPEGAPCLGCDPCRQFMAGQHRDFYHLDGKQGSIKIGNEKNKEEDFYRSTVRGIRTVLGEPPRGDGARVILLSEAQMLGIEAANALLKSLEEPRPGTSFVLTAPQRERLFPTLISRGWVLTLNWPETKVTPPRPLASGPDGEPPERSLEEWMAALESFLETGHGLFGLTGTKSAVNDNLANALVIQCQRDLAAAVAGQAETPFSRLLATRLGPDGWRKMDVILAQCRESLLYTVKPALVVDWLGVHGYALLHS